MNVLLINGSPREHGCTYTALREAADALERSGIGTEIFWVGKDVPAALPAAAAERPESVSSTTR